jgi:predicted esterase
LALAVAAGTAQDPAFQRYDLGKRLERFERAWAALPTGAAARIEAAQAMQRAVGAFFRLDTGAAAQALDHGYVGMVAPDAANGMHLLASLTWSPITRIAAPDQPVEVVVDARYDAGDWPDDVPLALRVRGSDGRVLAQVERAALPVRLQVVVDEVRDLALRVEATLGAARLELPAQTLSVVADAEARLSRLADADDGAPLERATRTGIVRMLTPLLRGRTAECDLPAARLCADAEATLTAPGGVYYGDARPGEHWLKLPLGRRSLPVRLFVPERAADDRAPRPLVLALHGAGGSENLFFEGYGAGLLARLCVERGWYLCAPRALPAGSAEAVIAALVERFAVDRRRVFVIGHSMGAMTAVDAAQRFPRLFARVFALGGGGRVTDAAAVQDVPFWIGVGERDFALGGARALSESLRRGGVRDVTLREYPGIEHMLVVQEALPDVLSACAPPRVAPPAPAGDRRRWYSGRVTDHRSQALPAASVRAFASPASDQPIAEAWTDAEGHFTIGFDWQPNAVLRMSSPGFAVRETRRLWSTRAPPRLLLGPRPARDLRVEVRDRAGAPIAGAVVAASAFWTERHARATTGADGTALLSVVSDDLGLRIRADGFAPRAIATQQIPADGRIRVELEPAATGTLRFSVPSRWRDELHVAVGREGPPGPFADPVPGIQLDRDGTAVLRGLVPGPYVVAADGLREAFDSPLRYEVAAGATVVLAFERRPADGRLIDGRVVNGAGEPIGGFALWLQELRMERRIDVGADGSFRFHARVPAGIPIAVWPDSAQWAVVARDDSLDAAFTIEAGESAPRVVVRPIVELRGRVVDPRAEPLAGAQVWIGPRHARASADGEFVLRVPAELPARTVVVRGHFMDAIASHELTDTSAPIVLQCPAPTRVTARIVDGAGRPIAGARANLIRLADAAGSYMSRGERVSGADGEIALPPPWPGRYGFVTLPYRSGQPIDDLFDVESGQAKLVLGLRRD